MPTHDRSSHANVPALLASRGALGGAIAALVFTWVHQWMISSIWFAFPAMLVAGVACGAEVFALLVAILGSFSMAVLALGRGRFGARRDS